jgi:hypothetical protein
MRRGERAGEVKENGGNEKRVSAGKREETIAGHRMLYEREA